MKSYLVVLVLLVGLGDTLANPTRLSCKFADGTEMLPFNLDLKNRTAYWVEGNNWRVVGDVDKFITLRSPDNETSIGGVYMVVNRFTGEFTQTVVSGGADGKLFGGFFKGVCNIQKF